MKRVLWSALFASAGVIAAPLGMDQFNAWDYDRDGFVDAAEARSSVDLSGRFNEIDANVDGRISAAEMEAWLAKPPGQREAWPPQPIHSQLQSEAIDHRRAEREAERAQRILDGQDVPPREAAESVVIVAPEAGASPAPSDATPAPATVQQGLPR